MLVRSAGLMLAAGLLAGCGGDERPAVEPKAPSTSAVEDPSPTWVEAPSPTSVVTPTQKPRDADRAALARLAEQAAAASPTARPPASRTGEVLGADISWPQCPRGLGIPERPTLGQPMPLPGAEFVVLGLTNGPGFTANPCLRDQVAWARERGLMTAAYAVASFPDGQTVAEHGADGPYDAGTDLGELANTGYQQALANIVTMRDADLATPIVWVDVEPVRDFEWSADRVANAAVVEGAARAYADAGYRVGVYSTPALWAGVVGDLALGVPEWRAAGQTSRAEARRRCGEDWTIQGGRAVLGQWVEQSRDRNLTCPGAADELRRWFRQS